jgi:glycosyltransferase involved in cell wall biosynthesis
MPEISVVIPTYNRASRLKTCLDALTLQTQSPKDFEVIVVVDGSTDETVEMLSELATPYTLKVLYQDNQGQNVARNQGVMHARGRYCLFLDDDIVAERQLISEHLQLHIHQDRVVGIGQITLNIIHKDWFIHRFADGWHEHYRQLNLALRKPTWADGYGGNISVSRALFMEVGGFAADIRRSHDIEFAYRLEQHGLTFVYLPHAIGRQDEHKSSHELFLDAEKSGKAWVTLCKRHPAMLQQLLGSFGEASVREALLREFLWWLRVSPRFLVWLGGLFVNMPWSNKLYRFLFTYGYWRGVRRAIPDRDTRKQMIGGVPILMYHAFGKEDEPASRFVLPINRFKQHLAWLRRLNYQVISLEDFLQYRRNYSLPPARSIIITIDDGYLEISTHVCPILSCHGFPATVFLISDRIGGCNDWTNDDGLKGRRLLSWNEIREIALQRIEFGAHSRTHPHLIDLNQDQARDEIEGSKADLENKLQTTISAFAYPYGEFDIKLQNLVNEAGFLGGCTTDSGLNSWFTPSTTLRRIEVYGTDSLFRFLITLWLGGRL